VVVDMLSHILKEARWTNHLLVRKTMHGAWGYKFPCNRSGGFHVVSGGSCILRHEGKDTAIERGDIVFVMRGVEHELLSDASQKSVDVARFVQLAGKAKGPAVQLLSVRYEFPDGEAHPFFYELPSILLVRGSEIALHHPLNTALSLLSLETGEEAGAGLLLERLTDVLLYYAIRQWLESNPARRPGYRSAMRDQKVLDVLNRIHAQPSRPWTLDGLARTVAISRASLASRFREVMGSTVMDYVTRTRLEAGRRLLEDRSRTLEEVAQETGYSSAFAFSKAFKRVFGASPRQPSIQRSA
jgi:AraC-like DNA-binding protein